ncbi:hypothetical protein GWK26_12830 [haloarchaeon 3A1-DGR]|nr:hypothetical protein GWK26_12830 [haloarchaeon 3A1-DGR]
MTSHRLPLALVTLAIDPQELVATTVATADAAPLAKVASLDQVTTVGTLEPLFTLGTIDELLEGVWKPAVREELLIAVDERIGRRRDDLHPAVAVPVHTHIPVGWNGNVATDRLGRDP